MTLTDAEEKAMWYADGDTLATVSLSGAALRELDPTSPNFLPPTATTTERVDAVRRALFKIAVYCLDRKLAVESNVTKRWAKIPEDARPPIEEIGNILNAAKVYRDRCIRDLKEENDQDEERPPKLKPYVITERGLWLTVITEDQQFLFAGLDEAGDLVFRETAIDEHGEEVHPRPLDRHADSGDFVPIVGLPQKGALEEADLLAPDDLSRMIGAHLYRYVDVEDHEYELATWYILYSWHFRKCSTSPYLRFLADSGKGKSRLVRTIGDLCFLPITAGGSSSRSGIMRFKERWQGTILIDESDLAGGAEDPLVKYLNLGFERGNYFILSDKLDPKQQEYFDPFGPKVIGMRQPFGDIATEGRCINITPNETTRTDIPVDLGREYTEAMQIIRAHIARFVLAHWNEIDGEALMDCSDIDVEPRLKQMLRPLSIVLQIFPDGEARFRQYMLSRQIEVKKQRSLSWEGSIFNTVYGLATGDTTADDDKYRQYYDLANHLQAVSPAMVADLLRVSPRSVTKTLTGIGFEPDRVQIDLYDIVKATGDGERGVVGHRQVRCYTVPSPQVWREIVRRYYFDPDDPTGDPPGCPEILRGREWKVVAQARLSEEAGLDDHPKTEANLSPNRTDKSYQTFHDRSLEGKLGGDMSVVSATVSEASNATQEGDPRGQPPDRSKAKYSPDPADYSPRGHTEYGQRCSACNKQGVDYRERPLPFNVKRGTRGLCRACYD
ncbi:MAG: hypothetical protein PHT99_09175, partial [Methanoregula sp.]|nr:hypothetical protein [Methanoregula sp.]